MFETTHEQGPRGAPDAVLREQRSSLSGFGGRPGRHPAWHDDGDVPKTRARAANADRGSPR